MALEAGDGFISGLVATNPVNATDQVAQGDDHIRLIKTALKGTFPNLNAAVTSSPAELNILDGATLSTAELNILDGVTLTAAQINDAARKGAANAFTGACTFATATLFGAGTARGGSGDITVSKTSASLYLEDTAAGSDAKIYRLANLGGVFELQTRTDANGAGISVVQHTRTGTASTQYTVNATTLQWNGTTFDCNGQLDVQGALTFSATLTTPNLSAQEVGFKGTPLNTQNGNYTLVLTDAGKTIAKASGGAGETITIPENGSVAFPIGTQIDIVNDGGGDLTIAITTDTLQWVIGKATGSRTLADGGWAVIKKITSTKWVISGAGLT